MRQPFAGDSAPASVPRRCAAALLLWSALTAPAAGAQSVPLYRDAERPVEQRVRDLLERMSPEEKFRQLYMIPGDTDDPAHDYSAGIFGLQIGPAPGGPATARAHAERINAIQRHFAERTRLAIPIIPFDEAVHGLAREGATMFPAAIALAATWDTALAGRVAAAIARETGSRGIRQVLSPVINVVRDVRWGRVEETYGEDPLLSSAMGLAFIAPFERAGIVTTPKHFVANVGEGGRDSWPVEISERQLDEVYFPPFEAAVRAGARSVMTAYNSVDGEPATQNRRLLTDVLRTRWGFTGFVISDAAATGGATVLHMTEPNTPAAAAHAWQSGLDVVFQSSFPQQRPYWDAVQRSLVPANVLDSAVARVLRVKFALGLFEQAQVNPDSAAYWNGSERHLALAREAAGASLVLLRNERGALPLAPGVRRVAVIGQDAAEARLGGYSGPGVRPVSILDGVRERLGAPGAVPFAPGPGRLVREIAAVPPSQLGSDSAGRQVPGLRGEYFDNTALSGEPRLVRRDARLDFGWTFNAPARGLPNDWYSVRWTGRVTAPAGGLRRLGVTGSDGYRLYLDDRLVIDNWRKVSSGTRLADVPLEAGRSAAVRLEYFETTGNAHVRLVWDAGPPDDWRAAIDSAVRVARAADVAIVVAGIEEGEFRDRAFLGLPGRQEELIEAVAGTGRPVVVVLIGGSAITMSRWIERVDAVLFGWYPGEAGGRAVADVLFGATNPAGRLPITFPIAEGQLPLYYNHKPTGRGDDYLDLTGQPLFPFGFGLSYTTFEYGALAIEPAAIGPQGSTTVRLTVRNTGERAGHEVVQLYLRDLVASVARPVIELKGFQRLHLLPGEQREVRFTLGPDQLRMLDRDRRPVVEPGTFRVMVGASSRDIRLRGELTVR